MCGIVGYIGKKIKTKKIIEQLKLLEYRGYDSAGVYFVDEQKDYLIKSVGNIDKLNEKIDDNLFSEVAIAHTRWATHGKPSEENSHPHLSHKGEWTIVHNGIIENYLELKGKLNNKPISETDTAVLSQFLEEKEVNNIFEFINIFNEVSGSYAIVAKNKFQNKLYLAKNKSPLYLAKTNSGFFIASDPVCFENNDFYMFNDGEFAVIDNKNVKFFNKSGKIVQKCLKNSKKIIKKSENSKNYRYFMEKEIFEQKEVLENLINNYKDDILLNYFNEDMLKNINKIKIVGCGTAFHSALIGVRYFQKILNIYSNAEISSEFIYNEPKFLDEKTLFIAVSQSGETADTLKAIEIAKKYKCKIIGITNVEYSSIGNLVDKLLLIYAGEEKAVASTKAYTAQVCLFYILANYFNKILNKSETNYWFELESIKSNLFDFNIEAINEIADKIKNNKNCIFIGKDMDYVSACESALKLKEISYINANSYPSGELKHGFLAMVENGTPLFVFASDNDVLYQKTINAANEAETRGAVKIIITNNEKIKEKSAKIIKIKCKNNDLMSIMSIIPMQYLAYKTSLLKGNNPDQPRNLAKSVTVE